MSQRIEQVASVLHHAVQQVLTRGLHDPRVRGLISVTKVEVSPDLADARVYISVLPAEHAELTLHGLRSAAGYIQREIASEVTARRMPRLSFRLDSSLKKHAMIDAALRHEEHDESTGAGHDANHNFPGGDESGHGA